MVKSLLFAFASLTLISHAPAGNAATASPSPAQVGESGETQLGEQSMLGALKQLRQISQPGQQGFPTPSGAPANSPVLGKKDNIDMLLDQAEARALVFQNLLDAIPESLMPGWLKGIKDDLPRVETKKSAAKATNSPAQHGTSTSGDAGGGR